MSEITNTNNDEKYHVYTNPRPLKKLKKNITNRKWIVFGGKSGWVGQKFVELLKTKYPDEEVYISSARLENRKDIIADFEKFKPTNCINAAGLTGRPNVDWCESNKQSTVRVNVMGTLNLIDICWQYGIHIMNCSTGCIYHYDDRIKEGSGDGFRRVLQVCYSAQERRYQKAVSRGQESYAHQVPRPGQALR